MSRLLQAGCLSLVVAIAFSISGFIQPSLDSINQVNPVTDLEKGDRAIVSLSEGTLRWRDRAWSISGSRHTPRGRFRLSNAQQGHTYGIPESSLFIPFHGVPIEELSRSHPLYSKIKNGGYAGTVFGIHKNNLQPGAIGAGCLLVSEADLVEMAQLLTGATIVIGD
ncbi:MAG: L,D-transpeptidase [Microcoleus sp.]